MMDTVLLFLYFILCVSGFTVKRSKVLTFLILLFAWVLIGWNYDNSDYAAYQNFYIHNSDFIGLMEPGYLLLCGLFDSLGFDYVSFRIITSGFVICIYLYIILKYACYNCCVAACYLAFLLILDVTQIRNFIAFSFVFLGLTILIYGHNNVRLKYILFVILASLIHVSSIFYLLFVNIRRRKYSIYWFIVLFIIELLVVKGLPAMLGEYISDKFQDYSHETSLFTISVASLIQLFNVYYIYIVGKSTVACLSDSERANTFYNMNLLLLFMIPFYLDTLTYMRIFRNISILNFIYITNALSVQKRNIFLKTIIFLMYASYFLLLVRFMHNFENVFTPVFEYNNFLSSLFND